VEDAAPTTSKFCEASANPNKNTEGSIDREQIIRTTVKLVCPLSQQNGWVNLGSGTIIDQFGTILTNKHVIQGTAGACVVGFITNEDDIPSFKEMADVKRVSTDVIPNGDMAILKIRNSGNKKFTAIDISQGNSDNLKSGDTILPFGYPDEDLFGETITFTEGPYAGKGTTLTFTKENCREVKGKSVIYNVSSFFKTTATVDHGNSGGGAYQKKFGYYVGIPTLGTSCDPNIPSRVNYILSVNKIKSWINSLGSNYSPAKNNFSTLKNYYSQSANIKDINLATVKITNSSYGINSLDKANTQAPDSSIKKDDQNAFKAKTLASTVASLGVRKSPSSTAKVVWSIKKGKSYVIIGARKDWYQIKISSKLSGWVMKKYVKTKI
jgi:S1-C subfamily serine protease